MLARDQTCFRQPVGLGVYLCALRETTLGLAVPLVDGPVVKHPLLHGFVCSRCKSRHLGEDLRVLVRDRGSFLDVFL